MVSAPDYYRVDSGGLAFPNGRDRQSLFGARRWLQRASAAAGGRAGVAVGEDNLD